MPFVCEAPTTGCGGTVGGAEFLPASSGPCFCVVFMLCWGARVLLLLPGSLADLVVVFGVSSSPKLLPKRVCKKQKKSSFFFFFFFTCKRV